MHLIAIRVTLPDQPGALARVASAIADMGGNIVDVDVHELDGADVVDELVIELPDEVRPGEVRSRLLQDGARIVESMPLYHRTTDVQVRCLDTVAGLLDSPVGGVEGDVLAAAVARVINVDRVRVGGPEGDGVAEQAVTRCVPVTRWLPKPDGRWLLALPYPEESPTTAIVVERSKVRFSATEVARVRALLRIHRLVVRLAEQGLHSTVSLP